MFSDMALNLLMLALAGVAGASFAWPMKYFRGWRWEHVWIGQALTSNLTFPLLTLALVWPLFRMQVAQAPAWRFGLVILLGMAWGLGGIGYGLSLVLLGLSFTYSVIFSVTTIFGALLPLWIGLRDRPTHIAGFVLGLGLCVAGIVAIAGAAARRDEERAGQADTSATLAVPVPPFSHKAALLVALVSGFFSAAMGLALVINEGFVKQVIQSGVSPTLAPLIVWVPLGMGSALVSLAFGFWCVRRSGSVHCFYQSHPLRNWFLVILMGVLGFSVLLLYGLGSTAQGHPSSNVSWAVYMSVYILAGNAIGILTREWKSCSAGTYWRLVAGITLLVSAIASLSTAY